MIVEILLCFPRGKTRKKSQFSNNHFSPLSMNFWIYSSLLASIQPKFVSKPINFSKFSWNSIDFRIEKPRKIQFISWNRLFLLLKLIEKIYEKLIKLAKFPLPSLPSLSAVPYGGTAYQGYLMKTHVFCKNLFFPYWKWPTIFCKNWIIFPKFPLPSLPSLSAVPYGGTAY